MNTTMWLQQHLIVLHSHFQSSARFLSALTTWPAEPQTNVTHFLLVKKSLTLLFLVCQKAVLIQDIYSPILKTGHEGLMNIQEADYDGNLHRLPPPQNAAFLVLKTQNEKFNCILFISNAG